MSIETIKECIHRNATLTSLEKRVFIDYVICRNHTGKMDGMISLSTSCICNPRCIARRNNENMVCHKCYAAAQMVRYANMRPKYETSYEFFNSYELTKKDVPMINASVFRLEAFGDIGSTLHYKNYCTIAKANNGTTFALWTKNPDIIAAAGIPKPKNMIIIYSEPEFGKVWTISELELAKKEYPFIDKIFCVVPKSNPECHTITCGDRKCLECGKCYHRKKADRIIVELEK